MVKYLPEIEDYLSELIETLYAEGYFSFLDQAIDYVYKIREYIETQIGTDHKRKAPDVFVRYGRDMSYIIYKANNRTSWYIFFQQRNDVYLVRYITNNHVSAKYFNQ
jgi:hypothetical protein